MNCYNDGMPTTRGRPTISRFPAPHWAMLLRAGSLAARPSRVGLSLIVIILIALIGRIPEIWLGAEGGPAAMAGKMGLEAAQRIGFSLAHLDYLGVFRAVYDLAVVTPVAVTSAYPGTTALLLLPMIIVWTIGGGAISRAAAEELATGRRLPWTAALAFSLTRWSSMIGSLLGPLVVLTLASLALAGAGWLCFAFPGVRFVGALLFILAMGVSLAMVLLMVGMLAGIPMTVPAVACEGTDAFDAVQRTIAYTFARPFRLAGASALLLAQLVIIASLAGLIAYGVVGVATWGLSLFLPDDARQFIEAGAFGASLGEGSGTKALSASQRIIAFWAAIPSLLVSAYVVSYFFSAGTTLYLAMRRICDAQEPEELWDPGDTPGLREPSPGDPPASDDDDED